MREQPKRLRRAWSRGPTRRRARPDGIGTGGRLRGSDPVSDPPRGNNSVSSRPRARSAVARCLGPIGRHAEEQARRDPPTSTGWRATAVTLAVAAMATLAGCTASQQPATQAGRAQLAGPARQLARPARQDSGVRPGAPSATTPPEPLLPPAPPSDAVNVPSGTLAPVYFKVPTTQPVVFLTIDDGWTPSLPVLELIRAQHLPVTVFLIDRAWRRDPAYFRALQAAGATVEDHTLTHPVMSRLPLARQEQEICGGAAGEAAGFGTRPTLFRPPFGAFDRATRLAARACHLEAVVEWTATVNDGHLVAVGGRLHRGYIILMHFRPSLLRDLTAALKAIRRAHLTIGRLSSSLESRT